MAKSNSEERIIPSFKQASTPDFETKYGKSEAPEAYDFFSLSDPTVKPLGFRVFFASGGIAAFYYHDLVSPMRYDGRELIEINFPSFTIRITGKNLETLFDYFFAQRVLWIKEPDTSFIEEHEHKPSIQSVSIEDKL